MGRASWLAAGVFIVLTLGAVSAGPRSSLFAPAALAQNIGMRTVSGTVLNAASEPVSSATVFLKNEKTKTIRSYESTADGHFHFAQVDMSVDYDLWAEKNGKKSATKIVSSWDDRKEFVAELKLK